jgi:hypothetical protein
MIDRTDIQLALRTKLAALTVATTGVTSLSATATGFHRTAGSFLADKFARGMWVTRTGFATLTPGVITNVTASDLDVTLYLITYPLGKQTVTSPAMTVESAASGRSLTVGLPAMQAWESGPTLTPIAGVPYVEEQYVPGPVFVANDGYQGRLEIRPMYSPRIYVGESVGIGADGRYADAMLRLFAPGTVIPLPTGTAGDSMVVRGQSGDAAASPGQRTPTSTIGNTVMPGWSTLPVNIPLVVRTTSSLP